jgi:sodium/potassium/calcium exchanger 6
VGVLDYYSFLGCVSEEHRGAGITVLLIYLIFLFFGLGISAEGYFCPSLSLISDSLHISENIAGVTFLSLGNGAPDVFSSFTAVTTQSPDLSLGALIGAGIFVNTLVVGTIGIITTFTLTRRPFLRDVGFYLCSAIITWAVIADEVVQFYETAILVAWYVIYVLVVFISRKLSQRSKGKERNLSHPSLLSLRKVKSPDYLMIFVKYLIKDWNRHNQEIELTDPSNQRVSSPSRQNPDPSSISNLNTSQPREGEPNGSSSVQPILAKSPSQSPEQNLKETSKTFPITPPEEEQEEVEESSDESERGASEGTPLTEQYFKRKVTRTLSLEGSFKIYNSETARLLLGVKDQDPIIEVPRASEYKRRRSLDLPLTSSQFQLGLLDLITLTPTLKSKISDRFTYKMAFLDFNGGLPPEDPPLTRKQKFLQLVFPLLFDWNERNTLQKVVGVVAVPIHFVLALTVPRLDYIESNEERLKGYFSWWSKDLFAINMLLAPIFITWNIGESTVVWGNFPVEVFAGLLGLVAGGLCMLFMHPDHPPKFYQIYGLLAFFLAVLWVNFVAGELVSVLEVLGNVVGVSETLLGLTVLAWGNSVGDWVADTVMARLGFANMGVSACFGSPMLNLLIGFGASSCYLILITKQSMNVTIGPNLIFPFVILIFILSCHLIYLPLRGFKGDRFYGFFLITVYIFFFTMNLCIEFVGVFS